MEQPQIKNDAPVQGQNTAEQQWVTQHFYAPLSTTPPTTSVEEPIWDVPDNDYKRFVGREQDVQTLHRLLIDVDSGPSIRRAGITGMGGIGKSSLAICFASAYQSSFPDGIIYKRIDHGTADELAQQLAHSAKIEITAGQFTSSEIMHQFQKKRMLLILDNAQNLSVTKALLPGNGDCSVLVTSRNRSLLNELMPPDNQITLSRFSKPEMKEFLGQFLDTTLAESHLDDLHTLLGGLPLALHIAGGYLQKGIFSIEEYITALRDEKDRLEYLEDAAILEGNNDETDKDNSVRASFRLSWKALNDKQRGFFACLGACAPDGFSKRAALAASDSKDIRLLDTIYALNLCMKNPGDHYALHPLLFAFARQQATEMNLLKDARQRHTAYFLAYANEHKSLSPNDADLLEDELDALTLTGEYLAENIQQAVDFYMGLKPLLLGRGHWSRALTWTHMLLKAAENQHDLFHAVFSRLQCVSLLHQSAQYEEAERYLKISERLIEQVEDVTQRTALMAMLRSKQGGIYRDLHNYAEAEKALKESLELWQTLGRTWERGKVLNKLGALYQSRDRFPEAEVALYESLAIFEQLHDLRRKSVVLTTLGGYYEKRNNTQKAREVTEEALALAEQLGDTKGLGMLQVRLGGVYQAQGQKEKAREALLKAFSIASQMKNYRMIASILGRLTNILVSEGKTQEALDMVHPYLELMRHSTYQDGVARILNILGELSLHQDRMAEAEAYLQESLKIARESADLVLIAEVFIQLGKLYHQQNNRRKEVEALQEVIQLCRDMDNKPGMEQILLSLGLFYQKQKWYEPASICFQKCFEIQEEEGSPRISKTAHILIQDLLAIHKNDLAQQYCDRALRIFPDDPALRKVSWRILEKSNDIDMLRLRLERNEFSEEKQNRAILLHKLGILYQADKQFDQAEQVFKESLAIGEKLKQTRHTGIVLKSLGEIYIKKGNLQQAETALEESYVIAARCKDKLGMAEVQKVRGKLIIEQPNPERLGLKEIERACDYLRESFTLYEELQNSQGSTTLYFLGKALLILNRDQEAQDVLQRAMNLWPVNSNMKFLQRKLAARIQQSTSKVGSIKRLIPSLNNKPPYGFITFDDGTPDVYFQQSAVEGELRERLEPGIRVWADIQMVKGRPRAIRVREEAEQTTEPQESASEQPAIRKIGYIKNWKPVKADKQSYGFIAPDDGTPDIFFHQEIVESELLERLQPKMRVWADVQLVEGKPRAIRIGKENNRVNKVASTNPTLFTILNAEDEKTLRKHLKTYEAQEKEFEKAQVLQKLGQLYHAEGRFEQAEKALLESLAIGKKLESSKHIDILLRNLGDLYVQQGKVQQAEEVMQESYTRLAERDEKLAMAEVQRWRGKLFQDFGDVERACLYFQESFILHEQLQNKQGIKVLYFVMRTLLLLDRAEEARTFWQRARELWPEDPEMIETRERLEQEFLIALDQPIKRKKGYIKYIKIDDRTQVLHGYIVPDDRTRDIYFGQKVVENDLLEDLQAGMRVWADVQKVRGKPQALRVGKVVETAPPHKTGYIKYLKYRDASGSFFGFIAPDDGTQDIFFTERVVDSDLMGHLQPKMRVRAAIGLDKTGTRAMRVMRETA